jgi:hypothetical protein
MFGLYMHVRMHMHSAQGMNTLQLRRAVQCDRYMSKQNIIVVSADYIPSVGQELRAGSGLIVNTEARQFSGEHWLAIWINADLTCELFDSLAHTPAYYKNKVKLIAHIRKHYSAIDVYNVKPLQHKTSNVCGQYVLMYMSRKSQGYTMSDIVRPFDAHDLLANDKAVYKYAAKHFTTTAAKTCTSSRICRVQSCRAPFVA